MVLCLAACPARDERLPCAVARLVTDRCVSCHSTTPANGAPMPLIRLSDFDNASAIDPHATVAQRSLERMKMLVAPMPPSGAAPITAEERATFEAWVAQGSPPGECSVDPVPAPLTCASAVKQPVPTVLDAHGGPLMAPGQACVACHRGENFEGQNPNGALQRQDRVFDVMGTVFPSLNEEDLCASAAGDGGLRVEIIDATGALAISAEVNAVGNFYGSADGGLALPFTARLVRGSESRAMTATQSTGDCNSCHTARGREGALGRIVPP